MKILLFALMLTFSTNLFSQVSDTTVLPVELEFFDAYQRYDFHLLEWKAESEENFRVYEVEQSFDGINFDYISSVQPNGSKFYNYLIYEYAIGNNYYRLKMIDNDGSFEYSNIRVINAPDNDFKFTISPTLSRIGDIVTVDVNAEDIQFDVYNVLGRKVYTGEIDAQTQLVFQEAGIYFVSVIFNQSRRTMRIRITE